MALAAAALLGGAGLVVDQDGDAGDFRELLLHGHEPVAVMDGEALGPVLVLGVFPGLVGDDDDALDALGRHLARDHRDGERAVVVLAAGHGDRVIEQDLVGDVDAGRDRGADRQDAGVVIGAVAEILEYVLALGERRLADPVGALAAHLGEAQRVAVHPDDHGVAADAGIGAHAFGHHGRAVVRAARAEIGHAGGDVIGLGERGLRLAQPVHPVSQLRHIAVFQDAVADGDGDLVGVERALDREEPFALLVALADTDRLVGGAVKLFAHLHFDQRALLLDHDDEFEPLGEFLELRASDRPGQAILSRRMPRSLAFTSSMPSSSMASRTSR